ncbi:MAG: hypothetical protein KDC09_01025 [Bacteroidales bacterium]|nr:hypothetical protein [Bacteroidales bacterium]
MEKQNKKSKQPQAENKCGKDNSWLKRKKTIRHRKEGLIKIIQYFNQSKNNL